jgi:hypothetical protein
MADVSIVSLAPNKSAVMRGFLFPSIFLFMVGAGFLWFVLALALHFIIGHGTYGSVTFVIAFTVGLIGLFVALWRVSKIRLDIDAANRMLIVWNLLGPTRVKAADIVEVGSAPYRPATRYTVEFDSCVYITIKNEVKQLVVQASSTHQEESIIHKAIAEFCRDNSIPCKYAGGT